MKRSAAMELSVLAGATLVEVALIPGVLIGGAAMLAPKVLAKYLPKRRRYAARNSSKAGAPTSRSLTVEAAAPDRVGFTLKQAVFKTITFRLIVTSLDFTTNYVVIGELAAAAGLSALGLVAGPLFYFAHEMIWNRASMSGVAVRLPGLRGPSVAAPLMRDGAFVINRALAKTITFRTIASTVDFTANYWVVGDAVTAAGLSAFGFVVGPFVYYGHEKAWDYFGERRAEAVSVSHDTRLLPAPA
jgi:uncharacterized membrane protein